MMAKLHASTDHNSNLNHRQQDNDFRSMIENSLDLIIKVNLSGHYTYVNPAFCALYGTNAEDLLGRHYSDDVHEDDRAMVDEFFSKLLAPPHTVSFIHRENTVLGVRRLEWTGKGIMNAQGELVEFVGIARDVTDRLDLIDKLAEQAYHDELTGLGPLSLFILDIDHFKIVNDHYGHPSGDIVLKQLSLLMKDALREHDLIVRIGGEEFAVLLPEADLAGAIVIAERLREAVAHHAFEILHGLRISLTISIGVASTSDIAHDFEKLMQEPDVRLYRAKSLGRNQVVPAQT
ncbi:MAG: hypothetical protein B7Y32_07905 [Methylophilales bacterium 16-45-7]|nr:MAG: hypothetical protein B7Y32_07905 [Methylophilales bacterium 16-45-7]